jgi:hypothetical protein
MAATAVEEMNGPALDADQKVVDYHAYVGVSTPRTVVDAVSVWLDLLLNLSTTKVTDIDLAKSSFSKRVIAALPGSRAAVEDLAALAREVDKVRQGAQHRAEITALFASMNAWEGGRWYFHPGDLKTLQGEAVRRSHDVVLRLNRWADRAESSLCALADAAERAGLIKPPAPLSRDKQ